MNSDQTLEIPGKRMRPFDIKDFILRRSLFVVAAGFSIFVLLSPAAFILKKKYFQTGGTILLSPEVDLLAPRDVRRVPGLFRDFAMTHALRLKSESVTQRALTDLPREQWASFLPRDLPVRVAAALLSRKLEVNPVGESQLLYVGIIGDEPGGLDILVNRVMETYLLQLEEEREHDSKRRLIYLNEEKAMIVSAITKLKERRGKLALDLKSNSFNELRNPVYERLIASQVNFLNASSQAMEKKSLFEKAVREKNILGTEDLTVFAREMVETNEAVYMIDNWTYQRLQDLRAGIDGLTPENSDRIHVEERMKAMTEYLTKFKADMHQTMLGILQQKRDFELNAEKTRAEGAFVAAKDYADKLATEMESAFTDFSASSVALVDGMEVSEEITSLKERLAFFDQRISEVILDAKAPIFLSLEELARPPLEPAGDKFYKILGLIFAGSMGLVGVFTLAFELLDGRIKSPGDVKSALGGLPLSPVPQFQEEGSFSQCVKSQVADPCSKAIRSSIVRLNIQRECNNSKIFLFCGSSPGSGVSSLVENFADGFAQYVDQVLILSFEGESTGVDTGKEESKGIDSLVAATLNQFPLNEPWVAKMVLNHHSPLMRQRSALPVFLSAAKTRFGVILIDARPLADSDLTQFLAGKSDSVILVAQRGQTKYASLRNDVEFLFRIGIPGLTAIFNGAIVQPFDKLLDFKIRLIEVYMPKAKNEIGKRLACFGQKKKTSFNKEINRTIPSELSLPLVDFSDQFREGKSKDKNSRNEENSEDVILPG
jgi:polysaccharide biosynthesis transport protein